MFWRVNGRIIGILLDFDLATITEGEGRPTDQTSRFRTGTPSFMAIDLLEGADGPHLYRYDLESFFYVLVYIGSHYNAGQRAPKPYPEWRLSTNADMERLKRRFIARFGGFNLTAMYMPLKRRWLYRMWRMFRGGYKMLDLWKMKKELGELDDDENERSITYSPYSGLEHSFLAPEEMYRARPAPTSFRVRNE